MKKFLIIVLVVFIIIIGIIIGINIYSNEDNQENIIENKLNETSELVTDECIYELNIIENINDIETNSSDEKISPNCQITKKYYYKECNHLINEYIDIQENLINCSKEDLEQQYLDWKVQEFSSTKIFLYKECEGQCGQHYVLREKDGKIVIFKVNENNIEEEYEITDISTSYLTDTDREKIEDGIKVVGNEELNQVIEDFE